MTGTGARAWPNSPVRICHLVSDMSGSTARAPSRLGSDREKKNSVMFSLFSRLTIQTDTIGSGNPVVPRFPHVRVLAFPACVVPLSSRAWRRFLSEICCARFALLSCERSLPSLAPTCFSFCVPGLSVQGGATGENEASEAVWSLTEPTIRHLS